MIGREGQRLKLAYQKAFEESFVDNYDVWHDALSGINHLIKLINEQLDEKYKTYSYNELCRFAKTVIDSRMEKVDWDKMVADEDRRRKKEVAKGVYAKNSKQRIKHNFHVMESDVLSVCFETAMRNSLGEKTYKRFKKEIEQRNNEVVL